MGKKVELSRAEIRAIQIAHSDMETYISAVGDEDPAYQSLTWAAIVLEKLLERLGEPRGWRSKVREERIEAERRR